ncbi:MAG: PadR family transcriptional regulator [Acidimicrobiia bacterium]|nr:PadR family transcriptional regulator [Acidimicrobiia bacterium]
MASETPTELPRRFLPDFLLLSLRSCDRSYGYELCQAVRAKGLSADLAAVYRSLRTLQRRGLVDSSWEPSESGPDRRVYVLTETGRRAAAEAASGLASIRDGLTAALVEFNVTSPVP